MLTISSYLNGQPRVSSTMIRLARPLPFDSLA
jgi:hypothetical protein